MMSSKMVVVTGGTKGIGRAILETFAEHGYSVATCSRSEEDLLQLKTEVEASTKVKIHTSKADLSTRDGVSDFLDFLRMVGKEIHVLVNNTGIFMPGSVESEEEGLLEKLIQTNLYSAYHLTRGLLPELKKISGSHIFNMCSIASVIPYAPGASYGISKFALYGFSKSLREELKEYGVRVTAVLPGATLTPTWDGVEVEPERLMKASDIAKAVWSAYDLSPQTVVEDILLRPQLGDL